MATNKQQVFREIEELLGRVPSWMQTMPESALGGFWTGMRDFYFGETVIPQKYKELIGIAVSGATRCRYCVLFHTEGARLAGASDEEIAEASAMASFTMHGSTFLNAMQVDYDEFSRETLEIVKYVKEQQAKKPATAGREAHA